MEKAYKLEFTGEKSGSLYVNNCGLSRTEPLHSFGPALKPHYLIHYILSGKGKLILGGKEYYMEEGNGFLIPPEELAFYQADEKEPWTYVWVGFFGQQAEEVLRSIGLSAASPVFKSDRGEDIYYAVKDMLEHNTFGISNELRRNGQLQLFLSLIAESAHIEEKGEADQSGAYVKRAVDYIVGNYYNPIKVADVANYVCINRSYLYTLFKNTMGMSPQQFLSTFRLTKAAELLELTTLPIESIALSCGYTDPMIFAKSFKLLKKKSPSVYRKEMQNTGTKGNRENLQQIEAFINQFRQG